jgi:hypothetical protein
MCLHTTERLKRLSSKQNKSTPKKNCKHQKKANQKIQQRKSEVNEKARASPVCQLAPIASSGELVAAKEEEINTGSKPNCIKQRASSG